MHLLRPTLALLVPLAGCAAPQPPAAAPPARISLETDLRLLSTDDMEGRGIGTAGLSVAAGWIAGRFASMGLEPAFGDTYLQPFDVGGMSEFSVVQQGGRSGPTLAGRLSKPAPGDRVMNVAALLPGRGALADEYVVVGAHYDHVGYGGVFSAIQGKQIHNGADDNASGTAVLMAIAHRLQSQASAGDARGVIFVAFTAEEIGLLGSEHFVENPPVAIEAITSMLNLDMVGRLRDNTLQVSGIATAQEFTPIVNDAFRRAGLKRKDYTRGGIGPSDHTSFAKVQIPVLFLFTGLHAEYHTPADDAERINYAGLEQVADVSTSIVNALRTMDRPAYDDAEDAPLALGNGPRVVLRFSPDYADQRPGVLVQDVTADGPAARAGIKAGDRIVSMNGQPIADIAAYMEVMRSLTPDEPVEIQLERAGQNVTVTAVPIAR